MNNKYLLLLGVMLFAALGQAMETAAAAISPATTASTLTIGPYAKRKALKPQRKRIKHVKGRPLVRATY